MLYARCLALYKRSLRESLFTKHCETTLLLSNTLSIAYFNLLRNKHRYLRSNNIILFFYMTHILKDFILPHSLQVFLTDTCVVVYFKNSTKTYFNLVFIAVGNEPVSLLPSFNQLIKSSTYLNLLNILLGVNTRYATEP